MSVTESGLSISISLQGVKLKVVVMTQDELRQAFLIHSTTPLQDLFQAFCSKHDFSMSESRFLNDGVRLCADSTAEQAGLKPGDVINFLVDQVGD